MSTLTLTQELISRPSITPHDAGCQQLLAERLRALGFQIEHLKCNAVDNLWARRGTSAPLFVFAGHTDVVPTGKLEAWQFPPFTPTIHEGYLYGRGAADMKGGIAAMVTACERFIAQYPEHLGSIGFLITSDEEGVAVDGTVKVVEMLEQRGEKIDWCLIGEPSSQHRVGDVMKNGRRGSLSGHLVLKGIQGHIAYPQLADNPIHRFALLAQALCAMEWDAGNAHFPPTSFQFSNVQAGTGAGNVIPGQLEAWFNFRYSTAVTEAALQAQVDAVVRQAAQDYVLTWTHSGSPFLTAAGELIGAAQVAVQEICGYAPTLSTSGGTSDGRFIAPTGAQVLELGVINATIHKIDECVAVADLDKLSMIYEYILKLLLTSKTSTS